MPNTLPVTVTRRKSRRTSLMGIGLVRMDLPKIIPTTGFSCPFFFTGMGGRLAMAFFMAA